MLNKTDFDSLKRMIDFMQEDLRHCIGADANFIVALALSVYTEAFGHLLPNMQAKKCYECYNEFLVKWMNYVQLIDPKNKLISLIIGRKVSSIQRAESFEFSLDAVN